MASFQIILTKERGIDIHCDNYFISGYGLQVVHPTDELYIKANAIKSMLSEAFDEGKRSRSREIKKLIG